METLIVHPNNKKQLAPWKSFMTKRLKFLLKRMNRLTILNL